MVRVELHEDSRHRLSSFSARGHAGWADSGEDIVCAAVSTVLQTAWMGLAEIAGAAVIADRTPDALVLQWPPETGEAAAAEAIAATAALALERLALQFPDHVAVRRVPLRQHHEGETMSEYKPIADGDTTVHQHDYISTPPHAAAPSEAGRALLAGIVGGLASAIGYVVYSRLPDEQRDRLHAQVRTVAESRLNEFRSKLSL